MDTATAATKDRLAHDESVRNLAYELWAYVASRDLRKVQALLAAGEYGDIGPQIVPDRTLRDWRDRYQWAARVNDDIHKIAPDLRYQAFSELLFAGLDGARYIRRVNAGEETPDKVRAQLAIAAVDRIGFSPIGKGDPAGQITPPQDHKQLTAEDVSGLSPEELMRRESDYRSSRSSRT